MLTLASLLSSIAAISLREYGVKWSSFGRHRALVWSRGNTRSVRSSELAIPDNNSQPQLTYTWLMSTIEATLAISAVIVVLQVIQAPKGCNDVDMPNYI